MARQDAATSRTRSRATGLIHTQTFYSEPFLATNETWTNRTMLAADIAALMQRNDQCCLPLLVAFHAV